MVRGTRFGLSDREQRIESALGNRLEAGPAAVGGWWFEVGGKDAGRLKLKAQSSKAVMFEVRGWKQKLVAGFW